MGWCLEDVLNLIKGFVDIMILASGYQSSGLPAIWVTSNIKNAIQWGLFFQDLFSPQSVSDDYQSSVKELDEALLEMTSNPYFPQGLSDLSSVTFTRARDYVLRHLIHTLPLRDAHLSALLIATIEMDLDELQRTEYDCLNAYLEKLMLQSTSIVLRPPAVVPDIQENASANHSEIIAQELSKRQSAVSCVSSVELGLNILCESVRHAQNRVSLQSEEQFTEFAALNQWRSKILSYLLHKRTVRLVSGAKLIFSAPKAQWLQVFERLKGSNEPHDDDSLEMIEIFLLGCASSKWTHLVEHFLSVPYCFFPISNQYHELHNLPQGRSQLLQSEKEDDILESLAVLLPDQLHQLWKLSPVLAAIAIPTWSPLSRLYISEIETQFNGDSSTLRCCSCIQQGKNHKDCELAERIWCLYVFHIQGSHQLVNKSSP